MCEMEGGAHVCRMEGEHVHVGWRGGCRCVCDGGTMCVWDGGGACVSVG